MASKGGNKQVRKRRKTIGSSRSKLAMRSQKARERALRALSSMRRGASLSRAARENGVTVRTVQRYVGQALLQNRRGGRIRAGKSDRLTRYLLIPADPAGSKEIKVRGSRAASEVAKYKAAVNRFLSGDASALTEWRGKKIAGHALLTDENTLKRLAVSDVLPYSLYRSFSGGGR